MRECRSLADRADCVGEVNTVQTLNRSHSETVSLHQVTQLTALRKYIQKLVIVENKKCSFLTLLSSKKSKT